MYRNDKKMKICENFRLVMKTFVVAATDDGIIYHLDVYLWNLRLVNENKTSLISGRNVLNTGSVLIYFLQQAWLCDVNEKFSPLSRFDDEALNESRNSVTLKRSWHFKWFTERQDRTKKKKTKNSSERFVLQSRNTVLCVCVCVLFLF